MTYALILLAYVVGATPTSYWVGKGAHGIDLRAHGSGNLGATNALRVLGWKSALPVVLVDVAKGYLPAALFAGIAGAAPAWAMAYGAAAIAGHMFSFWVGFRGGKGIATSAGVFLALAPWAVLVGFVVWTAVTFTTGYVSVGSIVAAVALPASVWLVPRPEIPGLEGFSAALAVAVIWAHRANIRRLLRGEENRFRRAEGGDGARESHGTGERVP